MDAITKLILNEFAAMIIDKFDIKTTTEELAGMWREKVKAVKVIVSFKDDPVKNIPAIEEMNSRIDETWCKETEERLSDKSLLPKYMAAPATKKNFKLFRKKLIEYGVSGDVADAFLGDEEIIEKVIPPGAKGKVRGEEFNRIVKDFIGLFTFLDNARFEITFEKHHNLITTTKERPDWYIYDKHTNKIIVGMNQIDLWTGGGQSNRESNYLCPKKQTPKEKVLCVVAAHKKITSILTKPYKTFSIGFDANILCYLNGLETIIRDFFELEL